MLLKSVHLNNIRSYVDQKIDFDNGVIVLAGDIGAGKTTVLLAVEFALFGIFDSGTGLLRKGTNDGSVELTFLLNNREFSIKRFLKRKSEGIRQTNGFIAVDGMKKDLTPIEMKQTILTLLGYPSESLAKKPLIYRFTTYTPQDEMKQILYEDADERINIIRKIFGIDKYQRIVENTSVVARQLKENKRVLQGQIIDLESKKNELNKINEERITFLKKEKETEQKLNLAKVALDEIKKQSMAAELELKKVQEIKKEKAMLEASIKHKEEQSQQMQKEIVRLESELKASQINPESINILKGKIKTGLRDEIVKIEQEQLQLQKQIGEHEAIKNNSEKIKKQISELQDCPLCMQTVPHTHKDTIRNAEHEKITSAEKKLSEIQMKIDGIKENLLQKNKELHESNQAEKELSVIQIQIKNKTDKETSLNEKKEQIKRITEEYNTLQEKNKTIIISDTIEKQYEQSRNEIQKAQIIERSIELEKTRITTEIKNSEKITAMLQKDIEDKEKAKTNIQKIAEMEHWLQNNFANIISMMERHVLSSIYLTFNDFFKDMFELLIDDERLVARIDESFTPRIEQNGHESEFESLSGGEKTSVCLAYRLALHKAVNSIISHINTRGLLILDEPTDGFSSEQLDKMRDIFDQLDAQQTIIVSHETKIESIADHVIRIAKKGHESLVL